MSSRVLLAPEVPELAALGAQRHEDFLDDCRALETGARAELLEGEPGRRVVRVPLPGTPDDEGLRRELPRGGGTGWLRVHTWESGVGELLRGRLRAPRSSSPAARRWNLACHLLAHGVGAARPLLLVEMPRGLGVTSLLVEGELEGFRPLAAWLAEAPPAGARARALHALGAAFDRMFRAGVVLPDLGARGIVVSSAEGAGVECAAAELDQLRREGELLRERGLRRARLPGIGLLDLAHGRIVAPLGARARLERLAALERSLAGAVLLAPGERLRLGLRALAGAPDEQAARAGLRAGCAPG